MKMAAMTAMEMPAPRLLVKRMATTWKNIETEHPAQRPTYSKSEAIRGKASRMCTIQNFWVAKMGQAVDGVVLRVDIEEVDVEEEAKTDAAEKAMKASRA